MVESNPIAEDLRFVRQAVEARDRPRQPSDLGQMIWTLYCLICIPAYDYSPHYGGRINLIGCLTAAAASMVLGKRQSMRSGQYDRELIWRMMMHWYGGLALLLLTVIGFVNVDPGIGEIGSGQLSIVLVGFLYYTAGVNFCDNRFMVWAGPVIIAAALCLGFVPHFRWTMMGLIFAVCLMSPVVARRLSHRPKEATAP